MASNITHTELVPNWLDYAGIPQDLPAKTTHTNTGSSAPEPIYDDIPDLISVTDSESDEDESDDLISIRQLVDSSSDDEHEFHTNISTASADFIYDSMPELMSIIDSDSEDGYESDPDNDGGVNNIGNICNWLPTPSPSCMGTFNSNHSLLGGGSTPAALPSNPTECTPILILDTEKDEVYSTVDVAEWIGKDKIWDDDIPRSVYRARNYAREIPSGVIASLIPPSHLDVASLLSRPDANVTSSADTAVYNSDLPNRLIDDPESNQFQTELHESRTTLLSALKHVPFLRKNFDNSWLSGATSIRLPGDPLSRYPLWTENLIGALEISTRKERSWRRASDWLSNASSSALDDNTQNYSGECRSRW